MYDRFADDALYSINIASPVNGGLLRSYNFRFSPVASDAGNYKISTRLCRMAGERQSGRFKLLETRTRIRTQTPTR